MIISITGKIGSGKDTAANLIQLLTPYYKWQNKKFAGKLKDIAELITGIPKIKFESQEFKQQQMPGDWNMTYREFLQKIGTDAMRTGLHENVWVNALFSDYIAEVVTVGTSEFDLIEKDQLPYWIITDCRFPNELEAVKKHGGITIKIERHSDNPNFHISETALDDYTGWNYVIDNNGSIEDLKNQLLHVLESENIIKYAGL